ncbi:MAG: hypothetical protein ACR2IE_13845 [Candidatus Sumerlaeaceae bacterium]
MSTRVIVGRERITVLLSMVNADVAVLAWAADGDHNGQLSAGEFTMASDSLTSAVAARFLLTNNSTPLEPSVTKAQVASTDPLTSQPHEISVTLLYTLPDEKRFEKLFLNPNLFRDIPGQPLAYQTPPQGSQTNQVTVFDCDAVTFETSGTRTYETVVGKCE